ncbi:hypothetical protein ACFU6K_36790 [Kitasatospora sp. NPDC057512]|uniref:hypothetical protein n=1 Tax=Kitasatospora sp. NPDC057512 TaxID=3346154 RepID=UPI0036A236FC
MTSDETTIPAMGVRPPDEVFDAIETVPDLRPSATSARPGRHSAGAARCPA